MICVQRSTRFRLLRRAMSITRLQYSSGRLLISSAGGAVCVCVCVCVCVVGQRRGGALGGQPFWGGGGGGAQRQAPGLHAAGRGHYLPQLPHSPPPAHTRPRRRTPSHAPHHTHHTTKAATPTTPPQPPAHLSMIGTPPAPCSCPPPSRSPPGSAPPPGSSSGRRPSCCSSAQTSRPPCTAAAARRGRRARVTLGQGGAGIALGAGRRRRAGDQLHQSSALLGPAAALCAWLPAGPRLAAGLLPHPRALPRHPALTRT